MACRVYLILKGFDMTHDNMTGAELQTMREACHLSRDDLAGLVGVQARTVKHWENGRAGVPADVAAVVRNIDQQATQAARHALGELLALQASAAPGQAAKIVLMRYRSAADMARYNPSIAGLPEGAQGCIVARIMQALAMAAPGDAGTPGAAPVVRVVWFNPDDFEAWRAAHKRPDDAPARADWAAQALPAQAQPHRADQPPA
jgi:DNA-binding XRE family transcriptional regulator